MRQIANIASAGRKPRVVQYCMWGASKAMVALHSEHPVNDVNQSQEHAGDVMFIQHHLVWWASTVTAP